MARLLTQDCLKKSSKADYRDGEFGRLLIEMQGLTAYPALPNAAVATDIFVFTLTRLERQGCTARPEFRAFNVTFEGLF